jgi:hypothetical protein
MNVAGRAQVFVGGSQGAVHHWRRKGSGPLFVVGKVVSQYLDRDGAERARPGLRCVSRSIAQAYWRAQARAKAGRYVWP